MVVWLIGLSGAGKSAVATEVIRKLHAKRVDAVLIDGDVVREIFNFDLGYSLADRKRNAERICQLCKLLDDQGVHVVCAILSLFPESREWNRRHLKSYYEVFIDAPMNELKKRDSKGIYGRFERGEITDVAGLDIKFQIPRNSDLTISNTASLSELLGNADTIVDCMLETQ